MSTYHFTEGTTGPKRFRFKDKTAGVVFDFSGLGPSDITLSLHDAGGNPIANPGAVTIVDPASSGVLEFTPADETVLAAKKSPYRAHFMVTKNGAVYGLPDGNGDVWMVSPQ